MARKLVMSVLNVELRVLLVNPFKLLILAEGQVNSTGWSEGKLEFQGLKEGTAEYTFTASPPGGPSGAVISTIHASTQYADDPQVLTAVRVVSANNEVIVQRDTPAVLSANVRGGGDGRPWPWRMFESAIKTSSPQGNGTTWPFGRATLASLAFDCNLRGMLLRVLRPGEVGTSDWNPNRVTMHVDESGVIEDVTFG